MIFILIFQVLCLIGGLVGLLMGDITFVIWFGLMYIGSSVNGLMYIGACVKEYIEKVNHE